MIELTPIEDKELDVLRHSSLDDSRSREGKSMTVGVVGRGTLQD